MLLGGCAYKREFLAEDFKPQDAYLANVQIDELSIVDHREKVPNPEPTSPPAKKVKVTEQPDLGPEHRALIQQEVRNHVGTQGERYKFTVVLEKGEKNRWPSLVNDREQVAVVVRVELANAESTSTGTGDVAYEITTARANKEYSEKLYIKALRVAIHQCFDALKSNRHFK